MPKSFDPLTAWWDSIAAANASVLTIGIRTADLAKQASRGDILPDRESIRMVSEKYSALGEGITAVSTMWIDMLRAPMSVSYEAAPQMMMAFVKPGYRKANANAKRLSRR